MKYFFSLSCFILLLFPDSKGQKTWSLQECVDYAVKNNIQIKQSELSSEGYKDVQTQSFLNLFPSLNGSAGYSNNFGRSVDPFSYQFTNQTIKSANFSLNSNVTLFNGFQLQNELKQSRLNYLASKADLDKIRNDVSLNVAAAYLQVLYSKELLKSADERVLASSKQRDRIRMFTDAGILAQGNLLDAESQLASEELNQVTAKNNLNSAKLSLIQLLELDDASDMEVETPVVNIPEQSAILMSPKDIFNIALTSMPEIRSADYKLKSAEKGLSISRGARFPRISAYGSLSTGYSDRTQRLKTLGGDYLGDVPTLNYITTPLGNYYVFTPTYSSPTFEKSPFSKQVDDNFSKSVGINISIPIFNGWSANTNVSRSKLNVQSSRYGLELAKNQLYKSIQQAHADALAALNRYQAVQKTEASMREAYRYAEKKLEAGLIQSLEFLTAQNNLSKAQSDLLQARYDYIFRIKVIDFYMGKPLGF